MTEGQYRHVFVIIEHVDGQLIPASLEMLGEARRLFDEYNKRYNELVKTDKPKYRNQRQLYVSIFKA